MVFSIKRDCKGSSKSLALSLLDPILSWYDAWYSLVFICICINSISFTQEKEILMDSMPPPSISHQYPYTIKRRKEKKKLDLLRKSYLDMGIKIIMLPNSVPAMIVLCDKSIPFSMSSVGSLYKYDPYNKKINRIIMGTTRK